MDTQTTIALTGYFTLPNEEEMKAKLRQFLPRQRLENDFFPLLTEYATKELQVFGFVALYLLTVEVFLALERAKDYSPIYLEILRSSGPSAMTAFLKHGEQVEAAIELLQEIENKSRTWPSIQ